VKPGPLIRYGGYVFSVAGARVAGILISALTFPYLVRALGVEAYGLWSYVLVLTAFLDILADPGITTYVTQQVAARRQDASELLPDYFALRLCGAAVAAIFVLGVAHFETRHGVGHLLRLYCIGLLLLNLISSDHFLGALEFFHARSVLVVGQQAIYAISIFLLVHRPSDVKWVPISILGSSALTAMAGWVILSRAGFRLPHTVRVSRWKQILVPSIHYAASTLMSSLYHRSGHLLVRWFLGDYALGLYAAAVRLVDLLRGLVTTVVAVLVPRLAANAHYVSGLRRFSRLAIAAMSATSIPMSFGLFATANLAVPLVLGANYVPDVSLVKWMSPYLITASAASLCSGTILYAMGRHRACLSATAGGALGGVLLSLVLIPSFGLRGAAVAFVLAELIVGLIGFGFLPSSLRQLWKSPVIAYAFASGCLMVIAVRIGSAYDLRLPLLIGGGACVYLATCAWFVRKWLGAQQERFS
jgi:O-antigen/teichoic acid export membrane protein